MLPIVQFKNHDKDGPKELNLKEEMISAIKDAKWLILRGDFGTMTNIRAA